MVNKMSKHVTILSLLLIIKSAITFILGVVIYTSLPLLNYFINDELTGDILDVVATFLGLFIILFSLGGIVIGVSLLKRKEWARIASLIFCIILLFSIPFGTVIGIYGLYVLMQDDTIKLFIKNN